MDNSCGMPSISGLVKRMSHELNNQTCYVCASDLLEVVADRELNDRNKMIVLPPKRDNRLGNLKEFEGQNILRMLIISFCTFPSFRHFKCVTFLKPKIFNNLVHLSSTYLLTYLMYSYDTLSARAC